MSRNDIRGMPAAERAAMMADIRERLAEHERERAARKMAATEQIETSSKKVRGRGMAKESISLIDVMFDVAKTIQPVTGRGIGYKLFARALIDSMKKNDMQRVYRLLKRAREQGIIPWEWIVDETRSLEKRATWDNPDQYMRTLQRAYQREFWNQQPVRCEVVSEKGTVRGVLSPVLDRYGVGFRVMHGFTSATSAHDLSEDDDGRKLVLLYVGDFDPSGMFMSEEDLPARFLKYDGSHIELQRIALTLEQLDGLQSFPASDKEKDPRYKWFVSRYGNHCWELDAMDPRALRDCVETEIKKLIEPVAWERCETVNKAEQKSIRDFLGKWNAPNPNAWIDEFLDVSLPAGAAPRDGSA
jgi:hypothetical protein